MAGRTLSISTNPLTTLEASRPCLLRRKVPTVFHALLLCAASSQVRVRGGLGLSRGAGSDEGRLRRFVPSELDEEFPSAANARDSGLEWPCEREIGTRASGLPDGEPLDVGGGVRRGSSYVTLSESSM